MDNAIVYIHGKGGSHEEAKHYEPLFANSDVIGFNYSAQTPWESKEEFPGFVDLVFKKYKSVTVIANRNSRKNMIAAFLDELEKQKHLITDFDTGLWNAVIETMTIYSKEHIVFKFKGGTEIKWSIV